MKSNKFIKYHYKGFFNKILHREDGPAVEFASGRKEWYINGERHRDNGPALEMPDGSYEWFRYGKLHREDGPAIEMANGTRYWILNGIGYTFDTWLNIIEVSKEQRVLLYLKWK